MAAAPALPRFRGHDGGGFNKMIRRIVIPAEAGIQQFFFGMHSSPAAGTAFRRVDFKLTHYLKD